MWTSVSKQSKKEVELEKKEKEKVKQQREKNNRAIGNKARAELEFEKQVEELFSEKRQEITYNSMYGTKQLLYSFINGNLILRSFIEGNTYQKIINLDEVKQMGLSYSYIPIEETERVVLKEKEKDASVVGRAVVGGLLLGGAGAVVGGMTGMNKNLNNQEQVQLIQKQSKLCDPVIRFTVIYKDKNKERFEYEYKLRNILITDLGKIDKYNQIFDLS